MIRFVMALFLVAALSVPVAAQCGRCSRVVLVEAPVVVVRRGWVPGRFLARRAFWGPRSVVAAPVVVVAPQPEK